MKEKEKSFTGISFPFRVGVKGGIVTSSTNVVEVPHIIEAMEQILLTRPRERGMEFDFKSDISTNIFDVNDASTRTLIAYQVREALRDLEDRVEVLDVKVFSEGEKIFVNIDFKVLIYNATYSANIKVGEIKNAKNV